MAQLQLLDNRKKNGGAGRGQGRKKGAKNLKTIERESVLRQIELLAQKRAAKMIDAQTVVACGTHKMLELAKVEGVVRQFQVNDEDRMQDLLDHGEYGIDYIIVVGTMPDAKAAEMILNRGLGKPKESVVHSGGVGVMHIIRQLNQSDADSTADN